jgi:hypothetical protein
MLQRLSQFPAWEADVMSVMFTHSIYTESCCSSQPPLHENSGEGQMVSDVLSQCGLHAEQLFSHLNSCYLLLVLPYNVFLSSVICFVMFMARCFE